MSDIRRSRQRQAREMQEKKKRNSWKIAALGIAALLCALYVGAAVYFQYHFYRGTVLYGADCGNLTASQAKNEVVQKLMRYALQIQERNGETLTIAAQDIGLQYADDGGIGRMLGAQRAYLWPLMMFRQNVDTSMAAFRYDKKLAAQKLRSLAGLDETRAVPPKDAYIMTTEREFIVVQEVMGDLLDPEKTEQAVFAALDAGKTRLSLDAEGCYQNPSVYQDDEKLQQKAAAMNELAGACIVYDFGDRKETVDAFQIEEWIVEADGGYALDEERIADYVSSLAEKYDTFGLEREFVTYHGETITLSGGDYGWCIDQEETLAALLDALQSDYVGAMEPVYLYTAMSRDTDDIGGTYVEVCISEQRMWCYEDGVLMVDTPVVTGNPSTNHGTPAGGVWAIDSKMRDYTLRGEGYAAPVDYWMAFNGDVGIHDLASRTEFGGNIYLTNGSHGCVNTPYEQAQQIYDIVSVGTPVVVYE